MDNAILLTVEFDPELKKWVDWLSIQKELNFSEALRYLLSLSRQIVDNEITKPELSKSEKLLIQCSMETLLILRETFLKNSELKNTISENAKSIIRKVLELDEPTQCHSS